MFLNHWELLVQGVLVACSFFILFWVKWRIRSERARFEVSRISLFELAMLFQIRRLVETKALAGARVKLSVTNEDASWILSHIEEIDRQIAEAMSGLPKVPEMELLIQLTIAEGDKFPDPRTIKLAKEMGLDTLATDADNWHITPLKVKPGDGSISRNVVDIDIAAGYSDKCERPSKIPAGWQPRGEK